MSQRLTPEQKAQQISADATEWMRQMRQANSHVELDRMMDHVRDQGHRRGIARQIISHIENVTYAETAAAIGPRKKARSGKDRAANQDEETGEIA